MNPSAIDSYLKDITSWAEGEPGILAVAMVGSYARGTATPESDIDLILVVTDPHGFLEDTAWASRFGEVQKQQVEDYGLVTSLRVWYVNGPEVEYGLTTRAWDALPLDEGTRRVIEGGIRVLYGRVQTTPGSD